MSALLRALLECGSYLRASLIRGFTVFIFTKQRDWSICKILEGDWSRDEVGIQNDKQIKKHCSKKCTLEASLFLGFFRLVLQLSGRACLNVSRPYEKCILDASLFWVLFVQCSVFEFAAATYGRRELSVRPQYRTSALVSHEL